MSRRRTVAPVRSRQVQLIDTAASTHRELAVVQRAAAQRTERYDERYTWLDERMVRRRDVGLDGDRHSAGGPAGRRNQQAVEEVNPPVGAR